MIPSAENPVRFIGGILTAIGVAVGVVVVGLGIVAGVIARMWWRA